MAELEIHPSVLIGCIALGVTYAYAVRRTGTRPGWRAWCWGGALAVVFIALDGPIDELSDGSLFSAHMVQHLLLVMVMPPLLLLGLSRDLVRPALRDRRVLTLGRTLTHPAVAFVAYNVVFIGWHFPAAYGLALDHEAIHIVQHLMFMAVGVMMWWPVVAPAPELERIPDGPLVMLYLFAFGLPMTLLSAFLTMSDRVVYPFYAAAPRVTSLGVIDDQRLGGLIMWVPGMLVYWIAISAVWFRWTRDEYREWRREALEARAAGQPTGKAA